MNPGPPDYNTSALNHSAMLPPCSITFALNLYFRCSALFGKLHVSTKGTIEDNGAGFLQVLFLSLLFIGLDLHGLLARTYLADNSFNFP